MLLIEGVKETLVFCDPGAIYFYVACILFPQFYRAMVHQAGANNMSYFVTFPEYGNTEEVSAVDLRPLTMNSWVSYAFGY